MDVTDHNPAIAQDASDEAETELKSWKGRRLGPYQLLELIGSGGMGEVYLAERIDHEFEQQVAIKVVRNSPLPMDVHARLRTERQILANLQHPYIARLLDGGSADDGTPYLVMEYIEGMPINLYCDRQRLNLEQRLELFCKVCAAVQCAHQNLIVHRDLKASNILVTNNGEPRLLDFGIAKLLDVKAGFINSELTQQDYRVMTPAHASPEQVRGEVITTASDIYVLGLLLYELLCGRRAFTVPPNCRLQDVEQLICQQTPPAPSTMLLRSAATTPQLADDLAFSRSTSLRQLRKTLQGDLDNIVMMALRKEPQRRYATASQFAEDVQHWLTQQPVIASKDSWRYRTSKFVKRHRLSVAASVSAILMLTSFSIITYMQARAIAQQRDAATAERNRAEQVSSFLVDLFELSDPARNRGDELKARELLDVGARRVDNELQSQPATRAMLLSTIGRVYGSLGLYEEAGSALEKSLQLRQQLYGEQHTDVADSLTALSETHIAQGRLDDAERELQQALIMQRTLHGEDAVEQAVALRLLGKVALERGNFKAAEQQFKQAMQLYDRNNMSDSIDNATAMSELGKALADQYQEAAAEPWLRSALNIGMQKLGTDHPLVAEQMGRLADALEGQGKYTEAASWFRMALDNKRRVLGAEHPETVDTLENYGNFLRRNGSYAQAQAILTEALQTNRKLYGEQHEYVGYDRVNIGLLYYDQGDYLNAEAEFRAALSIYAGSIGEDNVLVAGAQIGLARTLTRLGKPQQAEPLLHSAIKIASNALGENNAITDTARAALGIALLASNKPAEARALLQATRASIEETYGTKAIISREVQNALQTLQAPRNNL